MVKATNSPSSRRRRKRVLKAAKGFYGNRSKLIRTAYSAVARAYANAYVGRKQKKRQYRRLWTIRINAACRAQEFTYSKFINGLKRLNISLNRKVLADMAVKDPQGFTILIEKAKSALS
jgi:large subunit ribosomal protein L20